MKKSTKWLIVGVIACIVVVLAVKAFIPKENKGLQFYCKPLKIYQRRTVPYSLAAFWNGSGMGQSEIR